MFKTPIKNSAPIFYHESSDLYIDNRSKKLHYFAFLAEIRKRSKIICRDKKTEIEKRRPKPPFFDYTKILRPKLFEMLGDDYLYSIDNLLDVLLLPRGMEEEGDGLISEASCYGANNLGVVYGLGIGVFLRLEGELRSTETYAILISLLEIALGPENTGARNTHTDKLLNKVLGNDVNNVEVKKDGIPPIRVLTLSGVYGNSLDSLKSGE